MKNLKKISRDLSAKFCWQHFLEKPRDGAPYADEIIEEKAELNEEGKEKKEELNNQESITRALTAIEAGAQKLPEGFKKILASEFLKRSAEELQQLFIIDGVVDFRGNLSAKQELGLTDLFPKVSNNQQFVVVNGKPYAYGVRRHDNKIGYGNPGYKSITGGEKIEFFISPPEEENGQKAEQYISYVKDDNDQKLPPSEEFSYEKLVQNSANYSREMENLTVEKEQKSKKKFSENLKNKEIRKTTYLSNPYNNLEQIPLPEKTEIATDFFIENGYTPEQSAGLVGNLIAESNLNPSAIGDGGKAFGIAQWHPNRQTDFLKRFGKNIRQSTFYEQLEFVVYELRTTEKNTHNKLKLATTAGEAAEIVDTSYERSSGQHRQKRINLAENIQNKYENLA